MAIQGSIVNSGSLVTPGGDLGLPDAASDGKYYVRRNAAWIVQPPADATQAGLLNQLNGGAAYYVGGDNACHAFPLASTSGPGYVCTMDGAAGHYIGGDNAIHDLPTFGNGYWIKRTGDTIPGLSGPALVLQTNYGIGANAYASAPLQVSAPSGGGTRPQIGFYYPGMAASLYFEPTSPIGFGYVDSAGNAHALWEDHRTNSLASGYNMYIPSGAGLVVQSGGALYTDGQISVRSGGSLVIQQGGSLTVQPAAAPGLAINCEQGLGAASYSQANFRIYTAGGGARPGISFWHGGLAYACYLYFESNNKMRFITADGVVHEITSS